MVRLQLLCGMRPGEVCQVRPCDLTMRTDGVWAFRPIQHKTAHVGKVRTVFIGPEGQQILRPYLDRPTDSVCFSPVESEAERNAALRAGRKSPMTPSQAARKPKGRNYGETYDAQSYGKAVRRACRKRLPKELHAPEKESRSARENRLLRHAEWE